MRAVAIADDLTGALEVGALLAMRGLRTLVTRDIASRPPSCDALVIDTESRHLAAETAALRVAEASTVIPAGVAVFKKIDSTLRGNIAAEVRALATALKSTSVAFTPAYPQMHRTVRGGKLLVNGVEVQQTEFRGDPRSPVTSASVLDALDATTDEDLQRIVAQAAPGTLLAGSGGLARAWLATIPAGEFRAASLVSPVRPVILCGSRHPASREQVRRATIPSFLPPGEDTDPTTALRSLMDAASQSIRNADLIFSFGGDTTAALLDELGIDDLWPVGEIAPGVVLSRVSDSLTLVTKAGGFGEPDLVHTVLSKLQ